MSSPAGLEQPRVDPAAQPGAAWPETGVPGGAAGAARPQLRLFGGLSTGARLALALAAVIFLTALLAKAGGSLGATTLVEVSLTFLGAGMAAAAVLSAPTPRRPWGAVTLLAFAALAVWTALSVIWSIVPESSWLEANRMIAYLAVFAGAMGVARLWPRHGGSVLAAVLIASTAIGVIALALKSFPVALDSTEELARMREPVDYWNALGLIAALAIPPCLWLGARREGPAALRALAWPLVGIAVLVIGLSYSRGVLIAVAVGAAFWLAFVPLRLRGLAVGLAGTAGAVAIGVWAFGDDALSKDRAPLAARVDAGEQLALLCLLMVAVLFAAGLAANRWADRRPLSARTRGRVGLAAAGAGVVAVVALVGVLSFTGGGAGDRVSRAWDNFFSTTKATTTYGPERLKSIGTRRGSYWREAEKVWSAHKVAGAGAGGYAVARKRYREDPIEVQHAHGYVPQLAADLGLVGLALSLLVLGAWALAARRTLGKPDIRVSRLDPRRLPAAAARLPAALGRLTAALRRMPGAAAARAERMAPRTPVDTDRVALLTLVAVVVTFGVHSLIDWTWLVAVTALIALVCAGYVAGRGPAGVPGPGRPRPIGPRLLTAAGIGATALVAAWGIWQPLRSEGSSDAALAALESGRPNDALVHAQAARERDPLSLRPLFDIAQIQDAAGRKDLAQRAFEQAVKLQPSNPESWTQLASYQLNVLNQPSVAFQSARAALFLDPKSASTQALFLDAYRRLPRRPVQPAAKRRSPGEAVAKELEKLRRKARGKGG